MADNNSTLGASSPSLIGYKMSPSKSKGFPRIRLPKMFLNRNIKRKQKNRYICDKCDKIFPNWWERREHWLDSGHKDPEQCRWCLKKTFTLQSHICKHHWGSSVMCPNCGQMFMFREDLKNHQLEHDNSKYRCSHCGLQMKNEELLRAHVQDHFLDEKYGCNVCEMRFKLKKNLEKHLIRIHFICQYCGGTSSNLEDLKQHLKIHDDLKCLFCQKVFSQKNRLKYHYQLLHGHQDFYQCPLCFKRFVKNSCLLDHLQLRHYGKSNFFCKICAKPFLYWQHYKNHFEQVHLKKKVENKFDCSFCDYSTNLKFKLKCHVEKSSGIGFFCKKCQIRLECKGRFDKHLKDHDGETLWTCDYCSKKCESDNVLRHHIQVNHEHQKPVSPRVHPCLKKGCDRFYVTKSSLARHIRRNHSEPKNSTCMFATLLSKPKTVKIKETPSNITDNIGKEHEVRKASEEVTNDEKCNGSSNISDNTGKEHEVRKDSEEDTSDEKCDRSTQSQSNTSDLEELENDKQSKEESNKKGYHHMVKPLSSTIEVNVYYCGMCEKFWFTGKIQFRKHMRTHRNNVWLEKCDECNVDLETPEEAVKHYAEQHLKVEYAQ